MTDYKCWRCGALSHYTDECAEPFRGRSNVPMQKAIAPKTVTLLAERCTPKAIRAWINSRFKTFESYELINHELLTFLSWARGGDHA